MTDFVLIHGAFHGGWAWDAVSQLLRSLGHQVFAPTLPGCGEHMEDRQGRTTLYDQIDAVAALVNEHDLHNAVMVGHSLGGMVATGAADKCYDRIARLVYLDAFVPISGQSARDFIPDEVYLPALRAVHMMGAGAVLPVIFPVEKFVDVAADEADAFMRRLSPHPFLTFVEPVFLERPAVERREYIYCSGRPFGLFEAFAETAKTSSGWTYSDLPTAHDAMIMAPDSVVGLLAPQSG